MHEILAGSELTINLHRLINAPSNVVCVAVIVDFGTEEQGWTRSDKGQDFVIIVGNTVLVADESAKPRLERQPTGPTRDAASGFVGALAAHGREAGDGDDAGNALIQSCGMQRDHAARTIAEKIDA